MQLVYAALLMFVSAGFNILKISVLVLLLSHISTYLYNEESKYVIGIYIGR